MLRAFGLLHSVLLLVMVLLSSFCLMFYDRTTEKVIWDSFFILFGISEMYNIPRRYGSTD